MNKSSEIAFQIDLTPSEFQRRVEAMGIRRGDRESLRRAAPELLEHAEQFVDEFYLHLAKFPATASLLRSDDLVRRLRRTQTDYFKGLLLDELDWDYARRLLRIGEAHHRVGLRPKWYISAFAQYLSFQLPILAQAIDDRNDLAETTCALVRAVLFDASLALDAYGVRFEQASVGQAMSEPGVSDYASSGASKKPAGPRQHRLLRGTGISVDSEDIAERLAYIGLGEQDRGALRSARGEFDGRVQAAVAAFHDLIRSEKIDLRESISNEQLERLIKRSTSYWFETLECRFDRRYSMTRVRVGVIHEKLGIELRWYVVALGVKLTSMIDGLLRETSVSMSVVVALVKAAMFDMTFVVDSYMEARVASLVEMKGRAHSVVSEMTTGLLLVDEDLRVSSANWAVIRTLGIPGENLKGMRVVDAVPGVQCTLNEYQAQAEKRELATTISVGSSKCRVRLMPVTLDSGNESMAVLIDDLTVIIDALDLASVRETRYERVVEELNMAVWKADAETGWIEYLTESMGRFVPNAVSQLLGRTTVVEGLVDPADRQAFSDAWARLLAEGSEVSLEHRVPSAGPRTIWARSRLALVDEEGAGSDRRVRGDLHDITDSVEIREELAERLGLQQDATTLARLAMDPKAGPEPIRRLLELLARPQAVESVWILSLSGEARNLVAQAQPEVGLPACLRSEELALSDLRYATRLVDQPADEEPRDLLVVPIESDAADDCVLVVGSKPGAELSDTLADHVETMAAIASSFMSRWAMDREALRRQRLEALGTVASSVAHDLNNVLAIIGVNAELALSNLAGESVARTALEDLLNSSRRGAALTRDILSFIRSGGDGEEDTCEILDSLQVAARILPTLLPRMIRLEIEPGHRAHVAVGRSYLEQMLINLATNAAAAIGESGEVRIATRETLLEQRHSVKTGVVTPGKYVVIRMEDSGPGVPEELAHKIFSPFFSTRVKDGGTGLGLSAVARIASAAGGGVDLVSGSLAGACFELWLPVAEALVDPSGGVASVGVAIPKRLRILIVDDEEQLSRALAIVFSQHGHEATVCHDGTEAIARVSETFDAIITDYNLPGANGFDVLRAFRANSAKRKVLTSGVGIELPPDLVDDGIRIVLKPASNAELLASVLEP